MNKIGEMLKPYDRVITPLSELGMPYVEQMLDDGWEGRIMYMDVYGQEHTIGSIRREKRKKRRTTQKKTKRKRRRKRGKRR